MSYGHLQNLTPQAPLPLLCDRQKVIEQLKYAFNLGDEAKIDDTLRAVLSAMAREVRPFWRSTWRERLPGDGGHHLQLRSWPVEQVLGVWEGSRPVDLDQAEVVSGEGQRCDVLYREQGWQYSCDRPRRGAASAGSRPLLYTVEYVGGWLLPGEVREWSPATDYGAPEHRWIRVGHHYLEATTAGTSGVDLPAWPSELGSTITDGTVTWTVRHPCLLPDDIRIAAVWEASQWYRGHDMPLGVKEESDGGDRVVFQDHLSSALSRPTLAVLRNYQ